MFKEHLPGAGTPALLARSHYSTGGSGGNNQIPETGREDSFDRSSSSASPAGVRR